VVKALDDKAIAVDGARAKFRVKRVDSQSNPTRAGEVAQALIATDKVDLIVVAHTPDTTNPVGAVCEASRTPCISTVAPIGPWLSGGPCEWTCHFFWDLPDIIQVFTGTWEAVPTNKVVGGLWPNDPDGTAWAGAFTKALTDKGYKWSTRAATRTAPPTSPSSSSSGSRPAPRSSPACGSRPTGPPPGGDAPIAREIDPFVKRRPCGRHYHHKMPSCADGPRGGRW
jgi:ABC-type branched-subunit amino acid transport system substrate-binding protein